MQQFHMYEFVFYSRKHKQANTAEVMATCDLEMASEGPSRTIPLPQGHDHVYANTSVPIKRNPRFGLVQ